MPVVQTTARITAVTALSPTAREVTLALKTPMSFKAGAFVNVLVPHDPTRERRAFSIASSMGNPSTIQLAVRHIEDGAISPYFFQPDTVGREVVIMGPLGVNTVDKITRERVILVGFGIGVSVVKALVHTLVESKNVRELIILLGFRNEQEVLYGTFFTKMAARHPHVQTRIVLSSPNNPSTHPYTGYITDHLADIEFSHTSVYLCGKQVAIEAVQHVIHDSGASNVEYHVESFG